MYSYIPYALFLASEHKEKLALALAVHPSTRRLGLAWMKVLIKETVRFKYRSAKGMVKVTAEHFNLKKIPFNPVAAGITGATVAAIGYHKTHPVHKSQPGILTGGGMGAGSNPIHSIDPDTVNPSDAVRQYWGLPSIPLFQILKTKTARGR